MFEHWCLYIHLVYTYVCGFLLSVDRCLYCLYLCVCVCVRVCEREREKQSERKKKEKKWGKESSICQMSCQPFTNPFVFSTWLTDVDECKEQPDICNGGRCDNLPGGYRCICTGGLTASPDQKRCLGTTPCPSFDPHSPLTSVYCWLFFFCSSLLFHFVFYYVSDPFFMFT